MCYVHFNRAILDCVGFLSKCIFTKLTCCKFTVGPLFSINYNPVNAVPYVKRKGLLPSLWAFRQYIQPWLARYDWGKCGPDTLPFPGRQRLHYANVTTRGKREGERETETEREEKWTKKRVWRRDEHASRERGRRAVVWKRSEKATQSIHAGANMLSSPAFKCPPLALLHMSFKLGQTSVGEPVQMYSQRCRNPLREQHEEEPFCS